MESLTMFNSTNITVRSDVNQNTMGCDKTQINTCHKGQEVSHCPSDDHKAAKKTNKKNKQTDKTA